MDRISVFNTNISFGRRDRVRVRRGLLGCGTGFTLALDEKGRIHYTGDNRWGQSACTSWQNMLGVFCGQDYVLGLRQDGTVMSAGHLRHGLSESTGWACVTHIACGPNHAAALVGNGRVLCAGDNSHGQCETPEWSDMADVACGRTFTAGLCENGRVRLAGGNRALAHILESWKDVAALFSDLEGKQVLGISFVDGRLLSTSPLPLRARKWRNLVYVAASAHGILGITATGCMVSTRRADEKLFSDSLTSAQLPREYMACALSNGHMAVLCKNGEVLAGGQNAFGQSATHRWGRLFSGFEDFSAKRREALSKKERAERQYQKSLCEAKRFARRLAVGERLTACIQADGHVSATAGLRQVRHWSEVCMLECGSAHLLALHKDGRVSADGNNVGGCCRVRHWDHVTHVVAKKYHSLGLREDGTVLFAGWNVYGQGNVSEWRGIRLLRGTDTYTVGVDRVGVIHLSGKQLPFDPELLKREEWTSLSDLAVSEHHMVGLRTDGRVVAVGDATCRISAARRNGEICKVSSWRGVRAIAAGDGFAVGLCYGGYVVAAGRNDYGQCDTAHWRNVVAVGCGRTYTAALTADGRVLVAGKYKSGTAQPAAIRDTSSAVMDWEKAAFTGYESFHTDWMTDILTLRCGQEHFVAVDRYGQVIAQGRDTDGQCTSASSFVLFRDIRQLDGFGIFTVSASLSYHAKDAAGQAQ